MISACPAGANRAAWRLVGLLWFCGFFNYADRQAVFSVLPALKAEFGLDDTAKGMIGSAFMVVYAGMSPVSGAVVDRFSRRWLVAGGLGVWSLICALTGTARGFRGLLAYRAAEGLGESFYFPASMSLISAYHGPATRSRAMSVHQTSVYVGTAFGGLLAGWLGQHWGWRAPFWVLGVAGLAYAAWLPGRLVEPAREVGGRGPAVGWRAGLAAMFRTPSALALMAAFAAANFVAMALLSWMPDYVHRRFGLDLTGSAAVASLFLPLANLVGAVVGGRLADALARRHAGGRMWVQSMGLMLGTPCVFVVGWTDQLPLAAVALVGIGLGKGFYDANIFASLYDRVVPAVRGAAAGVMNTVGWLGASLAPVLVGSASDRVGLGRAMGATAWVYLVGAGLAGLAAVLAVRESRGAGG